MSSAVFTFIFFYFKDKIKFLKNDIKKDAEKLQEYYKKINEKDEKLNIIVYDYNAEIIIYILITAQADSEFLKKINKIYLNLEYLSNEHLKGLLETNVYINFEKNKNIKLFLSGKNIKGLKARLLHKGFDII